RAPQVALAARATRRRPLPLAAVQWPPRGARRRPRGALPTPTATTPLAWPRPPGRVSARDPGQRESRPRARRWEEPVRQGAAVKPGSVRPGRLVRLERSAKAGVRSRARGGAPDP